MKKKHEKIQITLILIGVFLILFTYFYYPTINKSKIIDEETNRMILDKKNESENAETTAFESIEYKGLYDLDKPFIISSKDGHILNSEPEIIYMNNLFVEIFLTDGRIVNITSKRGKYNKETYDVFFEEEVKASDGDTNIFSKNLDLIATKSTVAIYNDVSLNYPNGSLKADKIDYNFESKYFKVSMFDDESIKMKAIK